MQDIVVIGAGAAGLMAAIWARRTNPSASVLVLEGSSRPGMKILISGGGRCNVTHDVVSAADFAGSTRPAIQKVLRRFDVPATIRFFEELGVKLKREPTGKLFPVTDRARTVLDALWTETERAAASIEYPRRVSRITSESDHFAVSGVWGQIEARNIIIATGGKSVPQTGSDGHGYNMVQALGHTITPHLDPALVPLLLPDGHFARSLSGVATNALVSVRSATGKELVEYEGAILCTHFGLSGPAILDISRHLLRARREDSNAWLSINWIPPSTREVANQYLLDSGQATIQSALRAWLPERLIQAICETQGISASAKTSQLSRNHRKQIAAALTEMRIPVTGTRGFRYAEATAGGVPLSELHLNTMESRRRRNLYICGEICDVDGRIGGYNFQWAWSSGYIAGMSAALRLEDQPAR